MSSGKWRPSCLSLNVLKEVCGQMNCVNIRGLIFYEKDVSREFDVSDDNDDHFVVDIGPDKIISIDMILDSPETVIDMRE